MVPFKRVLIAVVVAVCLPAFATAQVTIPDTVINGGTDASGSLTASGTNRLVMGFALVDATADPTIDSATFNTSESMTDTGTHATGTGQYLEAWHLVNPSATSATIAVGGCAGDCAVLGLAAAGVNQTTPVTDAVVSESGGATSRAVTVGNMTANDCAVGALNTNGPTTGITPDSGVTLVETASSGGWGWTLMYRCDGSGALGASGFGSTRVSLWAARIAAEGGGGPVVISKLLLLGVGAGGQ